MYPDSKLKENTIHGTKENPISGMQFKTGKGTPYESGFFVERHWHPEIEILYIDSGHYSLEINLEKYQLNTGDICFLNGEDLHQITGMLADTAHCVLLFDPRILDFSYMDGFEEQVIAPFVNRKMNFPHVIRTTDVLYPTLLSLIRSLMDVSINRPDDWYLVCKLDLLKLLNLMSRQNLMQPADMILLPTDKQKIARYKTIISYIEEHYAEPVTLQHLADTIPCNSQYLCRFFKEITGASPIQYLIRYRVERACLLLTDTTMPILEISLDCGFDNVSYFIRKFKEIKGCTPREYRRLKTT